VSATAQPRIVAQAVYSGPEVYQLLLSKGETMIIPATAGSRRRFKRREIVQDILIVSSFCLWAVLIGAVPIMVLRALAGG
jgi:hypothetical protein